MGEARHSCVVPRRRTPTTRSREARRRQQRRSGVGRWVVRRAAWQSGAAACGVSRPRTRPCSSLSRRRATIRSPVPGLHLRRAQPGLRGPVLRRGAEDETRGRERRAGGRRWDPAAGIRRRQEGSSARAGAASHGSRLASPSAQRS
ncbi:hypothetical protein PVAP13_7NG203517 [Panicum virgatum]|uniref:Uncharacterized protein n=1 Tax=Panicum virgatum TaxID=38727 RepID=A0A8T0PW67_PANVG|nr:hypothetical protein PVAP13_7NG203517 [Panicum virgatum]